MTSRIDHFPDDCGVMNKLLSYLDGDNIEKIAPISQKVRDFISGKRSYFCEGVHAHPAYRGLYVRARLNAGHFHPKSFTVPCATTTPDKLELVRHPSDPNKLQVLFLNNGNSFDLTKTLEVDLERSTLTPTTDSSGLTAPVAPSLDFSFSHTLPKTFQFPRTYTYDHRGTLVQLDQTHPNSLMVGGRSLPINGSTIKDFTVMPPGFIAVQTDLSLQVYNLNDLKLTAEYPYIIGDTLAFTQDDKKLVGIQKINATHVTFNVLDFSTPTPTQPFKKITRLHKALFLVKEIAKRFTDTFSTTFRSFVPQPLEGLKFTLVTGAATLICLALLKICLAAACVANPILWFLGRLFLHVSLRIGALSAGTFVFTTALGTYATMAATAAAIAETYRFAKEVKVF